MTAMSEIQMGLSAFSALVKGGIKAGKALRFNAAQAGRLFSDDLNELAKKGMLIPSNMARPDPKGFIFGKKHGYFVTKPETEDGHVLVVGGVGSGKSSAVAIPSLMSWKERVFAIDIKGELYEKTRAKRDNIRVFNPMDKDQFGYDPFHLLRTSNNLTQDAREITLEIIPTPPNINDPFWIHSAQTYLTGALLHYCHSGYSFPAAMVEIQRQTPGELIEVVSNSPCVEAQLFTPQLQELKKEALAGVAMEVSNHIMVFATDPALRQCLGKDKTIKPADLEHGYDIYVCIPEDKLDQWRPLLTMMINQFMRHFERRPRQGMTPILFFIDEVARMGKIDIVNGLATLRDKKITFCLVAQSLAQFDAIYGNENRKIILDTCAYKAILNATDPDTQEQFSRMVGTYERLVETSGENYETGRVIDVPNTTSVSKRPEDRRIIKPEEFATLSDLKEMVLLTPKGFMRVEQSRYYETQAFDIPAQEWLQSVRESELSEYAQMVCKLADGLTFPVASGKMLRKQGGNRFLNDVGNKYKRDKKWELLVKMLDCIPAAALADKMTLTFYFLDIDPTQ
jgi:type IV secretion system protein VirD4